MECTCKENSDKVALLADFLRIISEENRLRILCMLKNGELCVCQIWKRLKISQNLASHHLKVLKDADIISFRKDGLNVYYRLNETEMAQHIKILDQLFKTVGKDEN